METTAVVLKNDRSGFGKRPQSFLRTAALFSLNLPTGWGGSACKSAIVTQRFDHGIAAQALVGFGASVGGFWHKRRWVLAQALVGRRKTVDALRRKIFLRKYFMVCEK